MRSILIGLALALAASTATARADTSTDSAFVQKAQADLLGQYALAALAKKRASNPSVRSLAQQVASNAAASSRFLDTYAKKHGITLSNKPGFRADAQYGEMSALKGGAFDKRFAHDVYTDTQLQSGDFDPSGVGDPALKRFAQHETATLTALSSKAQKLGNG
jgi:predicted outer membrane protein